MSYKSPEPFDQFKRGALGLALLLGLVSIVGLFGVSRLAVTEDIDCRVVAEIDGTVTTNPAEEAEGEPGQLRCTPASSGGFSLSPTWQTASENVLGALLAVAVVSIIFDFALRKKYGRDLVRFLGINEAMVASGLSGVSAAVELDVSERFESIDELVYMGRSVAWLNANLSRLLSAARTRKIAITIALPDPSDPAAMDEAGRSLGTSAGDLKGFIEAFVKSSEQQWNEAEQHLRDDTSLRVVYTPTPPAYDVIHATGLDAILLSKPRDALSGDTLLALTFEKGDPVFPAKWLEESLETLNQLNDVVSKLKKKNP